MNRFPLHVVHSRVLNWIKMFGKEKDHLAKYSTMRQALPEIIVATFVMNILSLALPLSLLQVYDRIIPNSSFGTLTVLVFGILIAVLLETILRIARGNIIGWVGTRFEHSLGVAAFRRILYARNQGGQKEGVGDTLERISCLRSSREYYSGQLIASLLDVPFVFVFLGIIYILGGPIVYVPVVILAIFGLVSYFYGLKLRHALRKYSLWKDRRLNFQIEALTGIHTIKSLGLEAQMEQRHTRLQDSVADADQEMVHQDTSSQHISFLFAQLTMVCVAAYGSTFVVSHDMTVGALAACTLLAGRAMQPFQRLTGLWSRLQNVLLSREKVAGIFDLPVRQGKPDGVSMMGAGRLALSGVSFGYNPDHLLFEDLDFVAEPGECIGISGGNGVGKSTLLGLMRGTLDPLEGRITIDDHDLGEYTLKALRGRGIAYIPQNGEVFHGTILDNLTMFNKLQRKKALQLAEGLGLDEVVAKMSRGYETEIGNSGIDSLPHGIRQRIAIARALLPGPRIILFDEANGSIDGPGDTFLRDYLKSLHGDTTQILVTPRPSFLRAADRIFEIEGKTLKPRTLAPVPVAADMPAKTNDQPPATGASQ